MNPQIQQKLKSLIVEHGTSLLNDPRRIKAMLKDLFPQNKREVRVLSAVLDEGLAQRLLRDSGSVPTSVSIPKYAQILHDDVGVDLALAQWAVETYAIALSLEMPKATPAPTVPPIPKPTQAPTQKPTSAPTSSPKQKPTVTPQPTLSAPPPPKSSNKLPLLVVGGLLFAFATKLFISSNSEDKAKSVIPEISSPVAKTPESIPSHKPVKTEFERALEQAERGSSEAQFTVANMYANGNGISVNDNKAIYWYKKAADQNHAHAQFNLGVMSENGWGTTRDKQKAIEWYKKAANQGYGKAKEALTRLIGESEQTLEQQAENGNAEAQFNLGKMYSEGKEVSKNDSLAVSWYRKAANQDHARAQLALGVRYLFGKGISKDEQQSVYWFQKAANNGLAEAQFNLGDSYAQGRGTPQSDSSALYWFRKAADQGIIQAQINLGFMYSEGKGTPVDYNQAAYWYQKAANQGDTAAQFNLGALYEEGLGVDKNDAEANRWYRLAARQGDNNAKEILKEKGISW